MSLPPSQLRRLNRDLRVHQTRLSHLTAQIERLAEEAGAHETIVSLGRDPRVLDALAAIHRDPPRSGDLEGTTPEEYLRAKGVELPDGSRVSLSADGRRTRIALHLTHGRRDFACVWDSEEGFSLAQDRPTAPPPASPETED